MENAEDWLTIRNEHLQTQARMIDHLEPIVEAARRVSGCRARLAALHSGLPPVDHGRLECGACDVCRLVKAIEEADQKKAAKLRALDEEAERKKAEAGGG